MTMNEQETTIFDDKQVKNEKKKETRQKAGKWVKVGSGAAVLLGGAAILSSFSPDETDDIQEENDIKDPEQAETDFGDGEPSFSEVFAEARAAQGPGGVFTWHGNQYSTYLKEEWDALTSDQQEEYTEQAVSNTEENDVPDTNATNTAQLDQTDHEDTNATEPDISAEESNDTTPTENPEVMPTNNHGGNEVEENGRFDIGNNGEAVNEDDSTPGGNGRGEEVLDPEDVLPFEEANVIPEEGEIVEAEDVSDDKNIIREVVEVVTNFIHPNNNTDVDASEPEVSEDLPNSEDEELSDTGEDVIPDSYEKIGEDMADSSITQEIELDMPDYMPDANL